MFNSYLRTEQTFDNQRVELTESDFDNLYKLYQKCPLIQREVEKRLSVPLKRAQMSDFSSPYTGGIWLPYVTAEAPDKKAHVERAQLGVSFTPIEVRIGLNFGVGAHRYRAKYYELLLNGALTSTLEALNRKATGYCLTDTYWHYHTRNTQSLQWTLTLYGSTKLAIENAIEETKQQQGNSLTAHKYLVSKVITRRPEDFTYTVKGLIDEISKDLNELYPALALIDKK